MEVNCSQVTHGPGSLSSDLESISSSWVRIQVHPYLCPDAMCCRHEGLFSLGESTRLAQPCLAFSLKTYLLGFPPDCRNEPSQSLVPYSCSFRN